MSLKAFHIVFIALSALLSFGFGLWVLIANSGLSNFVDFIAVLLSFLVGVILVLYGIRFLRKFKKLTSI